MYVYTLIFYSEIPSHLMFRYHRCIALVHWHTEVERNRRHFADDIFKCIFLNVNVLISREIALKFVSYGPINNIPLLVKMMAWCRPSDKPLSESRMVTHICITRPQWVKSHVLNIYEVVTLFHLQKDPSCCTKEAIWFDKYTWTK